MNIIAIVQARMSSRRLPGKVLAPIVAKPMLALQMERLRRVTGFSELVVATSDRKDDDDIVALCRDIGCQYFRGSLDDVLDRFFQVANQYDADHVVRLAADCPLADPQVIDHAIRYHLDGGYDFTSNTLKRSWPQGLDVEVVLFRCLEEAWREARLPSEREHVTPFITSRPERYALGSIENETDLSQLHWTVDEPDDLDLIRRIYEHIYPANPAFMTDDDLNLIEEHPDLEFLNAHIDRLEGLRRSVAKDHEYLARWPNPDA